MMLVLSKSACGGIGNTGGKCGGGNDGGDGRCDVVGRQQYW